MRNPWSWAIGLAGSPGVDQGPTDLARWSSASQPWRTGAALRPEHRLDRQRIGHSGRRLRRSRVPSRRSDERGERRFLPGAHGPLPAGSAQVAVPPRCGLRRTEDQPQTHGQPGQGEAKPALHPASPSRARRKLRCLFNSASSRKHCCSFCQAATPSRVACSAALGT